MSAIGGDQSQQQQPDDNNNNGSSQPINAIPAIPNNSLSSTTSDISTATAPIARVNTRAPTPYPDILVSEQTSPPFHLAEAAANATVQLQEQINMMAQAISMQNTIPTTLSAAQFPIQTNSSDQEQQASINPEASLTISNARTLSHMLDQYVSAATASEIGQREQQIASYNQSSGSSSSISPSTIANFSPLAAYLQGQYQQQSNRSTLANAVQLLQQQQNNSPNTQGGNNHYSSLLSNAAALCECNASPMSSTIIPSCPYHSNQQSSSANNGPNQMAEIQLMAAATAAMSRTTQMLLGQGQQTQIVPNSPHFHPPLPPLTAPVQSNQITRAAMKRSSDGTAAFQSRSEGINPSPSSDTSQYESSNHLFNGLANLANAHNRNTGPIRGPKLRRMSSIEMTTNEGIVQSPSSSRINISTDLQAPLVASSSSTSALAIPLNQEAAPDASLQSAATILESTTFDSSVNSQHQQQPVPHHFDPTHVLGSTPNSIIEQNDGVSLAGALGSAAAASISAGVEQIVAVALNAATAANAALSPQSAAIAAMAAVSGYPQRAAPPCAICAAAAGQSRMGTPMAATVTACSCLHHHHLHCHHNTLLTSPVCTLCNSNVISPPATATLSQFRQNSINLAQQIHSNRRQSSNNYDVVGVNSPMAASGVRANSSSGSNNLLQPPPQLAQPYLLNPNAMVNIFGGGAGSGSAGGRGAFANTVGANVNLSSNASGSSAAAATAALSPSVVTAMLLNTAMSQQSQLIQPVHQSIPSFYGLQRNNSLVGDVLAHQQQQLHSQQTNLNSVQNSLFASRLAQQERERDAANQFYQQQQQRAAVAAAAAAASQQQPLMRPLIMVPRLPSQVDLANVFLLHHPATVGTDAATLVLNGSGNAASAFAHTVNPHHVVANAMATAAPPEPQPIGVTMEQIKKHSQKLAYVKDPDVPEQERDRCTVCLNDFETGDELRALNCTHLFHTECIDRWLQYNKKCPVCRLDMDKSGAGSSAAAEVAAAEAAVVLNAFAAVVSAASNPTC